MPRDNRASIADRSGPSGHWPIGWMVFFAATVVAAAAAVRYAALDLTLSHYDARAHLVVARRIVDSLTPGWRQVGAVWLPLPHLLDIPAVWTNWGYRTGFIAVGISVLAMAGGLAALAAMIARRTGSTASALSLPALVLLNPNVLYLTSTPMTEPLLLGLAFGSVAAVDLWMERDTTAREAAAGLCLAALALTRYEGWLISGALVAASAAFTGRARGVRALGLVPYLGSAVLGFLCLSRASTGAWFVSGGFFEVDPTTYRNVSESLSQIVVSTVGLAGRILLVAAAVGAATVIIALARRRSSAALIVALLAAGVLPLYAFYEGHPHRIRYMVPIVTACAALASLAVTALPRRLQTFGAVILVGATLVERPPFDATAPMPLEAQWETPFRHGRQAVTAYLSREHDGTPILASMGSLGHYMQESSHAGFRLKTFLHEGNGDLWSAAIEHPARHVRWVLVEERAEGGDQIYQRASSDAAYLTGFARVAEGGGLALYRRRSQK